MKKTTKIFGLLLTLFGLALVTGCTPITDTPEVPEETTYTVTFDTNGGSPVKSQTIKSGEKATKPADPTKTATNNTTFTFDNWYTSTDDGETLSETAFDFDTEIKADITLYAKWNETTIEPTPENDSDNNPEVNPGDESSESDDEETAPTEDESEEAEEAEPIEPEPADEPSAEESSEEAPTSGDETPTTNETPEGTNEESGNDDQNTGIIPVETIIKILFMDDPEYPDGYENVIAYELLINMNYIDNDRKVTTPNGLSRDDIKFLIPGVDTFIFSNDKGSDWYYSLGMDKISIVNGQVTLKYYYQEENN